MNIPIYPSQESNLSGRDATRTNLLSQDRNGQMEDGEDYENQNRQRMQVKILSYNMFIRPPPVKNNEDDYKDERLTAFISKEMENFDIICFQELFRLFSTRRHKMVYSGIKKGFLHHSSSPSPSFFSTFLLDGGLAILSKHPIVSSKFYPYTFGIFSDGTCQKGVLYSKIILGNKHLHLFNTHTQASYPTTEEEIKKSVQVRLYQFIEMRSTIEEALQKNEYSQGDICILTGDFNIDANHPKHPFSFISDEQELMIQSKLSEKQMKDILEINNFEEKFDEYEALLKILSGNGKDTLIDVIKTAHNGQSQITYGDISKSRDGTISPLEVALTDKRDICSRQSLDYIMELIPKDQQFLPNKNMKPQEGERGMEFAKYSELKINVSKSKVEPFFIQDQKFTQLSDHYGVSSEIYLSQQ